MNPARRFLIALVLAVSGLGASVAASGAHAAPPAAVPTTVTTQAHGICVSDGQIALLNFCWL